MKRTVKQILCLLMGLALLMSGTACSFFASEKETQAAPRPAETQDPSLLAALLSEYVIVYPERSMTQPLKKQLNQLAAFFKEAYGVEPEIRDDFVREGTKYTESRYEILIGRTNRQESVDALAHIRRVKDYELRLCGDKLVVGGISEEANVAAVTRLLELLYERRGEDTVFDPSMNLSHTHTYGLEDILLGGVSIDSYTVVYEGSSLCMTLANRLSELITEKTGYLMTVQAGKRTLPEGRRIFVGKTAAPLPDEAENAAENAYYVGMQNGDLYLYGATAPAMTRAMETLTAAVEALSSGEPSLTLSEGVTLFADHSLKAMSFNVYWDTSDRTRMENVLATIRAHMPDTFGVQEATQVWMNYLNEQLGEHYAYVGVGRNANGGGEYSAVFYRKDRLQLVESHTLWLSDTPEVAGSKTAGASYPRVFTYALLELRETGQRFLHVNTHTDHVPNTSYNGEQVRLRQINVITSFLKEHYPDTPTVLTGDLNDVKNSLSIEHLLSFGFEDSADVAIGTDRASTFSTRVIDYIMVTKGDFIAYEYKVDVTRYNGEYPSDHRAIVLCYELK